MSVRRSRSTAVWFVSSATRLPRSLAGTSARNVSMPGRTTESTRTATAPEARDVVPPAGESPVAGARAHPASRTKAKTERAIMDPGVSDVR